MALVGYTNAGKSTLLNRMIDKYAGDESKKVLEKDMLFATLETTVRKIELPDRRKFLLSDTVGFIHKLPPSLIKAFRSTLEEIKNADLLLHVIDYADKNYKKQIAVTEKTLEELGCASIPVIYVYNKSDLCMDYYPKVQGGSRIYMAAGSGEGMNELLALISQKLFRDYKEAEFLIPYDKGQIMSYLMENALLKDMEYTEKGIYLKAACSKEDHARYEEYLNNDK